MATPAKPDAVGWVIRPPRATVAQVNAGKSGNEAFQWVVPAPAKVENFHFEADQGVIGMVLETRHIRRVVAAVAKTARI